MKDPIKIIHKFKNNNRSIQYKVFIFIGPLLSEELTKILKIIENKDFFNSLLVLNNKQYEELEKYYGEFWYQKFFISYHLKSQIKQIDGTTIKKKQIISKFGDEWYKKHINVGNFKKISYSFAASYYENLLDKKKIILSNKKPEIDFRTITQNDKINLSEILESNEDQELNEEDQELLGGDEDDDDIVDLTDDLVELTDDFVDDNKKGKKSKKKKKKEKKKKKKQMTKKKN